MTRVFIWLLLLISLGACYNKIKAPSFDMELVLPPDTMVSVLTDIHLAEGIVNIEVKKNRPVEQVSGEYFHTVLQKHHISLEAFQESVRYYAYYADKMDAIYEKVIINLSKTESLVIQP